MKKLKPQEVAQYREKLRKEQKNSCPLCSRSIRKHEATLDHDHDTGHVRSTLHRNCNSVEGRIKHWARRSGISPVDFIRNLLEYWCVDYTGSPLHPNHRTEHQQRVKQLRRRLRKAKRPSTKARLKKEIQELLDNY